MRHRTLCCFGTALLAIISVSLLDADRAFADEWKPSHALVSHTGVMNLSDMPPPSDVFFPGPDDPSAAASWLEQLKAWRDDRRVRTRYDDAQFIRPELEWTQHVFSQVQLLIWDRSFYDPEKGEYTVAKFLAETEARVGPIDAVLIWHVYPNLGVDDRNQFDLIRDLPGGIPALRAMVQQFHSRGVRVFFPYLAWDSGTRDEAASAAVVITQLLSDIGADGINFDTLESVPAEFRTASDSTGHPLALEPQFEPRDESVAWTNIGWNDWVTGEGKGYPFVPMVDKTRWLEPRHTVAVTDRFTRDKTDSLQHAFFNGEGYAVLENLWGFWYGMNANDAEALLRFTRIERALADQLQSPGWEPHTPTLQSGVFASKFPTASRTLWTIINKNEYTARGEQLIVPHRNGLRYYDLWHGKELTPTLRDGKTALNFEIDGRGFGAILATEENSSEGSLRQLLSFMADRSIRPLSDYPREWKAMPQTILANPPTKVTGEAPSNMVRVAAQDFNFEV
ncbi:MAG: hypothetical protein ABJA69_06440, partial [Acidobacteriaceae bacterium]